VAGAAGGGRRGGAPDRDAAVAGRSAPPPRRRRPLGGRLRENFFPRPPFPPRGCTAHRGAASGAAARRVAGRAAVSPAHTPRAAIACGAPAETPAHPVRPLAAGPWGRPAGVPLLQTRYRPFFPGAMGGARAPWPGTP